MTLHMNTKAKPSIVVSKPQEAEALVLNCMDHRLISAVAEYLDARGLAGKYDQISLAGGAIGVMAEQDAPWSDTFWAHVKLARELHGIDRVIVIDHRDCGACKAFVGQDCADDREHEAAIHAERMGELAGEIETREPGLEVELLLMELDGTVSHLPRQSAA